MNKQKCANTEEHEMERGDRARVLRYYPPMGDKGTPVLPSDGGSGFLSQHCLAPLCG